MSKALPKKGIYWLASYPKSGNTWTRSFIKAIRVYQRLKNQKNLGPMEEENEYDELPLTEDGLVDINALNTGAIASARGWVEQILGFDTADLSQDETDLLRPDAYRWYARQMPGLGYHKIHDAYTYLPDGTPLIPQDATLGALCIIRNPLDVAISFANHSSCSIDASIQMMGKIDYAFCPGKINIPNQLRQWLLPWSDHVASWTEAEGLNRLIVRYEDMKQNSLKTFSKIARFLQLPHDKKTVETILEQIKIERFQAQEAKHGFNEKAAKVKSFFRKGIVGDWQETLTDQQINRIIDDHYLVMQKFGYLDKNKNPTSLILPK